MTYKHWAASLANYIAVSYESSSNCTILAENTGECGLNKTSGIVQFLFVAMLCIVSAVFCSSVCISVGAHYGSVIIG